METIGFNEWAFVLLMAFSVGTVFAGFLGWLLVERKNAPFKRKDDEWN